MYSKKSGAIAIFFIMLILTFPIYSAQVLAADLRNPSIHGTEDPHVEGYVRYNTDLIATVEVEKQGDFAATYVRLGINQFDSCTAPGADGYRTCTNTITNYQPTEKDDSESIILRDGPDPDDTELARISGVRIIIDQLAPVVNSFTINPSTIGPTSRLSYVFQISDDAFSGSGASICSGIPEYQIYRQGAETAGERARPVRG